MSDGDGPARRGIPGEDPGRSAIVQALRRYFDQPPRGSRGSPGNTGEHLVIKALKNYFKREGWS